VSGFDENVFVEISEGWRGSEEIVDDMDSIIADILGD